MKTNIKFLTVFTVAFILFSCKKEATINTEEDVTDPYAHWGNLIPTPLDSFASLEPLDTSELFSGLRNDGTNNQILRLGGSPFEFELTMPPIKDQGNNKGDCAAWAMGYAVRSYHLYKDHKLTKYDADNLTVMSPTYMLNSIRKGTNCGGLDYLETTNLLKSEGIACWNKMPHDYGKGCSILPSNAQKDNAQYFKIEKAFYFTNISQAIIKDVIYQGFPIAFGCNVDSGTIETVFDSLPSVRSNFIWKSNRYEGSKTRIVKRAYGNKFAHAMVICGWSDAKNAYKVWNCSGTQCGDNGYIWIDYDYFNQIIWGVPGMYNMFVIKTKYNKELITKPTTLSPINIETTSATLRAGTVKLPEEAPLLKRGIQYGKTFNVMTIKEASNLTDINFSFDVNDLEPNTHYEVITYSENVYGKRYDTLNGGFKTKFVCDTSLRINANVNGTNISTSATGGNPPYSYLWSNGMTSSSINVNATGTYTVTVTDLNGCKKDTVATVSCDTQFKYSLSYSTIPSNICVNADSSSNLKKYTASPIGGYPPYELQVGSSWQSSMIFEKCGAAILNATIRDRLGCIATKQ